MIIIREELEKLLDNAEVEQKSYTPDFILAQFLFSCLSAFDEAINSRDKWYGVHRGSKTSGQMIWRKK
ncbi:MAG: hypothetical protein PHX21_13985 [bacterium]|nr:hypothetical protein [bacterium]